MFGTPCYLTHARNFARHFKESVVIESKPESVEDAVAAVTGGVEAVAPKRKATAKTAARKTGAALTKAVAKKPARKPAKKVAAKRRSA